LVQSGAFHIAASNLSLGVARYSSSHCRLQPLSWCSQVQLFILPPPTSLLVLPGTAFHIAASNLSLGAARYSSSYGRLQPNLRKFSAKICQIGLGQKIRGNVCHSVIRSEQWRLRKCVKPFSSRIRGFPQEFQSRIYSRYRFGAKYPNNLNSSLWAFCEGQRFIIGRKYVIAVVVVHANEGNS